MDRTYANTEGLVDLYGAVIRTALRDAQGKAPQMKRDAERWLERMDLLHLLDHPAAKHLQDVYMHSSQPKPGQTLLSDRQIAEMHALKAHGATIRSLAITYHISDATVKRYLARVEQPA